MSSHHIQSNSDSNYLLCLQNLRIDETEGINTNRPNPLHASLHNPSTTAIESLPRGNGNDKYIPVNSAIAMKQSPIDYKLYDRNNVIAASKYGSSKQIEEVVTQHHHQPQSGIYSTGYFVNSSPTQSLSGSSQHSESPRGSLIGNSGSGSGSVNISTPTTIGSSRIAPVYENIEYYSQAGSSDYHNLSYYGSFESSNKKAQPQVPSNVIQQISISGGRFAHTPQPELEATPIYENLPAATGNLLLFKYLGGKKSLINFFFDI